jgi:hypothetical protein
MSGWVGPAIGAAAGLGSAYISAQANRSAARQVANATRDAAGQVQQATDGSLDFLRESRDIARGDLAPYRDAGLADYNTLRGQIGTSFQASPGYEFARGEGIRAIDQAASARGMLGSGGRLRELMRYGTGVANQEYGNWLSRLQGLAGVGQTASGQSASLAQGAGQNMAGVNMQGGNALAGLIQQGGAARAAGTVGTANALLGGANTGLGLYALLRDQPQAQRPGVP